MIKLSTKRLEKYLKALEKEELKLIDQYQELLSDNNVILWQKTKKTLSFIRKYLKPFKIINYFIKNSNRPFSENFQRIKTIFCSRTHIPNQFQEYQNWVKKNFPSKALIKKQRKKTLSFNQQPVVSIIVPTFNTPPNFLIECVESVINQSYPYWELCIADDGSTSKKILNIIREYTKKHDNIKAIYKKNNEHISAASNSALKLATGDFVALLDHDDILWPNALFEVVKIININPNAKFIYTDEDKLMSDGVTHTEPFFKPDWSPDYLRSINYITHFAVLKKSIIDKIGGFRIGYEGAQDWDLFLRATKSITNDLNTPNHPYIEGNKIIHIPKVLYSWRISDNSTASAEFASVVKDYAYKNQKKVLEDDLKARGLIGGVEKTEYLGLWNIKYKVKNNPKVSIIIPTKNQYGFISKCIKSIYNATTYDNFEILILDTGSDDVEVLEFYKKQLVKRNNLEILNWKKNFNFSAVCNYGASQANGDYFLFLNNDIEVLSTNWIERMLGLAQLKHIAAVSAKLLYPDHKIQHLGGLLGITGNPNEIGIAGHAYRGQNEFFRHFDRLAIKNYSFVTGACLLIKKEKFVQVNGFDEAFQIAFNDVDFCLRLNNKGYFHVIEPYVELLHKESASLKKPGEDGRDLKQWKKEIAMFLDKWDHMREKDPFYNINLSLNTEDFSVFR